MTDEYEYPYVWWWHSRLPDRKGQRCKTSARGKLNTIRVDFPDGFFAFTNRYAVRKAVRTRLVESSPP